MKTTKRHLAGFAYTIAASHYLSFFLIADSAYMVCTAVLMAAGLIIHAEALDPNNVMAESSIPEGCALSDKGVLRGIPKADWPEGWEDVELEDGYVLAGYGDGGRAEINSRNQMEGRPDFWVQSTNCWEAILYALPTNAPQSHFDRFTYEALETEYATLRAQVQGLADSVIAANQTRMDVNPMECINANALALRLAHKAKGEDK